MVMAPQTSNESTVNAASFNVQPAAEGAPPEGSPTPDMSVQSDGMQPEGNPQINPVEQKLDALQDQDKAFLAQYLTPEFIYAVGLVSSPETAQYLSQFVDQSKVLVPVDKQYAEQLKAAIQQKQQQDASAPQPQGQPQPAQQQGAPTMQPQAPVQAPAPQQQTLPNGVTPAPIQNGIMAPQGNPQRPPSI